MGKIKEHITILTIGDRVDHDSYRKFHKEVPFILESGFGYASTNYERFLAKGAPPIKTKKVIVFLFFPFFYWNKYIEHKNYKGLYGNRNFYKKFIHFWDVLEEKLKKSLKDKEVFFVNSPSACGLCRDKLLTAKKFLQEGIPGPKLCNISRVKEAEALLNKGHSLFLKPRYGSMGKGITFLSWANWQTNFIFRNGKIISRRSDHGWKFTDITGSKKFLGKLLKKNILIEEEIKSLLLKKMKIDLRMYVFFNEVVYIYPRKNREDKITTNISQGAKGDPDIAGKLPEHLIKKAKKLAQKVSNILRLDLAGIDIMMDRNLKDVHALDANAFPGFPRRRTFNLAQCMIKELTKLVKKKELHFEKACNI